MKSIAATLAVAVTLSSVAAPTDAKRYTRRVHGPVRLLPHHRTKTCEVKWVAHHRVKKCNYH